MTLEKNNTVTQREHPAFEDDYIAPHRHPSDVSDRHEAAAAAAD